MSEITTEVTEVSDVTPPGAGTWAVQAVYAGTLAFTATTGALLKFAHARGEMITPFARVGRRVARDIALPGWGDVTLGLGVHLGHSLALGAIAALLVQLGPPFTRVRSALIVVLFWQLAGLVPWLAVIRADRALQISSFDRAGLALLLAIALGVGTRSPRR